MAEQEREKARNELALSNQRLNVAEEERARAEQKLLEDHRGAGQVGDWLAQIGLLEYSEAQILVNLI